MRRLLLFTVSTLAAGGAFAAAVGLIDSTNQQPIPDADLRYASKQHAATHGAGAADELSLNASQITAGELPDARIADNITAGQFATNPTACTSGQFVTDISAAGTLTCAAPPAGGGTPTTFDGGTYTEVSFGSNIALTDDGDGTATVNVSAGTATIGDGDYGDIVVSGTGTVMTIDAGVVGVSKLASADFGDFTCDGSTCTLDGGTGGGLQATDIAAGTITPAAGNLNLTGTNGQILVLDLVGNVVAGTLTDAAMTRVTLPTAGTVESWWRNPMAMDAEIVAIWCESDQTVNLDVHVDDGTPSGVAGSNIACTSTPSATTTLTGDTVVASGETLDLAIASVAGTPEWLSIQVVVEYK